MWSYYAVIALWIMKVPGVIDQAWKICLKIEKNTYKESIFNNKEPLWCNNVDMTSWISSYFWIYVYEHIKVLGSSSVFRLMNIKSMLAQESITILYNVYTNMNKHIQKLDSWAAMHFQFLRFWRITTKKIISIFFEIAKA